MSSPYPLELIQNNTNVSLYKFLNSSSRKDKVVNIMFFAPWCGHCKNASPILFDIYNRNRDNENVKFRLYDCEKSNINCTISEYILEYIKNKHGDVKSVDDQIKAYKDMRVLQSSFVVNGFPTFIKFLNGFIVGVYNGSYRNEKQFEKWLMSHPNKK